MITLSSMALKADILNDSIHLKVLDQTLLPTEEKWLVIADLNSMLEAIKSLRVRGAPLIGVAASLSLAQLAVTGMPPTELLSAAKKLYHTRPTAVNLMNCIDQMTDLIVKDFSIKNIVNLAVKIFNEDVALCEKIAAHGALLIEDGDQILTHCNTGGLATAGNGTALGVLRKAFTQGKKIHVYVDETRPLLQGARLTAWELKKLNIPFTLITDNMAAHFMKLNKINKAIVGCDRIALNGDFANKIGTYSVAVNCFYHKIPFLVAAPYTTVDLKCKSGSDMVIEERDQKEVTGINSPSGELSWAPKNITVSNPAFDITPASLVSNWILDRGIYNKETIEKGLLC